MHNLYYAIVCTNIGILWIFFIQTASCKMALHSQKILQTNFVAEDKILTRPKSDREEPQWHRNSVTFSLNKNISTTVLV